MRKAYPFLIIVLIFIFALLTYRNSLKNSFVYDDWELIVENNFIKNWKNVERILTREYFALARERSYRPLCTLSFFLDYLVWKLNPYGWHLTNIFFHTANAILIYFLVRNFVFHFFGSPLYRSLGSLLTALIFLVHPLQTEAVNGISLGREDLISFFFFFLAFYLYLRSTMPLFHHSISGSSEYCTIPRFHCFTYIASCVSFLLALFAKEMAVTLPFVLLLYNFSFVKEYRRCGLLVLPYFFLLLLYILGFFLLYNPSGSIHGLDIATLPRYPDVNLALRVTTNSNALVHYLGTLFLPRRISLHNIFPVAKSLLEPQMLKSIGILLAILVAGIYLVRFSRVLAFSIFYFFFTLVPVSNLVPIGTIMHDRYLYFSLFGFSLFLGTSFTIGMRRSQSRGKLFFRYFWVSCFLLVILFFVLRTARRNLDWMDDLRLWSAVLRVHPQSAEAYFNLGNAYAKSGRKEEAVHAYQQAIGFAPRTKDTTALIHNSLGLCYLESKEHEKAMKEFERSLEVYPNFAPAYTNIGVVYAYGGKNEEAVASFKKAVELNPNFAEPYLNLAKIYRKKGMFEETINMLNKVEQIDPANPEKERMYRHIIGHLK